MTLLDIVHRQSVPQPWDEGDNIPWHNPGFSQRMLREHLSQSHNAASRRFEFIDRHVEWIHQTVLSRKPSKILDLGCGPGFYTSRLATWGHECVGIDYSPASLEYAKNSADKEHLQCQYIHQDIRIADYGTGYGLVMLIFGEFNVFKPIDAKTILAKAHRALAQDGLLLLEPHTFAAVQKMGTSPRSWYSSNNELFSDRAHICLKETFWDVDNNATTIRYFVIDASTGNVTRYAQSIQAYTDEQYQFLLRACEFDDVTFYPSLLGSTDPLHEDFITIVSQKSSQ